MTFMLDVFLWSVVIICTIVFIREKSLYLLYWIIQFLDKNIKKLQKMDREIKKKTDASER